MFFKFIEYPHHPLMLSDDTVPLGLGPDPHNVLAHDCFQLPPLQCELVRCPRRVECVPSRLVGRLILPVSQKVLPFVLTIAEDTSD